jgi:hypothetical protein
MLPDVEVNRTRFESTTSFAIVRAMHTVCANPISREVIAA